MDTRIANVSRPDVIMVESTARPTPKPARVAFKEVLAAGATTLVHGAEVALSKLPGSPITAAAVRGGSSPTPMNVMSATGAAGVSTLAEGPGATAGIGTGVGVGAIGTSGVPAATDGSGGGIEAAMQQQAELSLYYLQIQQQEDSQNRSFTAMSNILKTEHDSAKSAINNIHS
jgi:hypothetical protein